MDEILARIFKRFLVDEGCGSAEQPYVALDDYRLVLEGRVFISDDEHEMLMIAMRDVL